MNDTPIKIQDKSVVEKVKVVATGILGNEDGKVLAIKLKDTDGKDMYITPGGRPDLGESLRGCVTREYKEEVNLDVEVESVLGVLEKTYEDGVWTFLYFKVKVVSGEVRNNESEEIQNIEWVDIKELDGYESIRWVK